MGNKYKKLICFILAFFMFFSGMCFGTVKADSLLMSSTLDEHNSCISSIAAFLAEEDFCTAELISVRNTSYIEQVANKGAYGCIELGASFQVLCADIYSQLFSNFFTVVHAIQFQKLYSIETVLSYIHNMDGKKRI